MELKYTSWDEITIALYKDIHKVMNDDALSDAEKEIALLAILCDVEEEKIWDMSLGDIQTLRSKTLWVNKFHFDKTLKFKKINIGNIKCRVETDLSKMTVAQYIDYQNYLKRNDIAEILTCFIIPEGKKYGEDYDITEFKEKIERSLSIIKANEVCFFFMKKLLISTEDTLKSLDHKLMRMMKRERKDMTRKQQLSDSQVKIALIRQVMKPIFGSL